ncbi:DUF4329 domain-containing protein [Primorskyibacter sp. S87]|uniref:DUF4329 domain-containing protein n=1 Tax=Primorskyibacter sp. S87 TaxID=3415126 RepID=UPI003C7DD180
MILALALLLTACVFQPLGTYLPPPPEQVERVKARFAPLQQLSFAAQYEYCGYLGRAEDQTPTFTEMVRGGHDGCTPNLPKPGITPIASLHTHGSYDPDVPAEFPTVRDMESDRFEGVNGYIATPGGRLWYIDSRAMVAVQLCGLGCLPQDPEFHAGDDGEIAERYTYAELKELESVF